MKKITVLLCLIFFGFVLIGAENSVPSGAGVKKKKTIVFKEMKVKGTIQKPEAIYILSRARFNYQTFDLNISFVSNIKEVIKDGDIF